MKNEHSKNILLTNIGGYPSETGGGALKIIYLLLLYGNDYNHYDFFSYDFQSLNIKDLTLPNKGSINHSILQQLRRKIISRSEILKAIAYSSYYSEVHLFRQGIRFKRYSQKKSWDIIHSHSTIAMDYLKNSKAKKILSIHSKGCVTFDLMNNASGVKFNARTIKKLANAEKRAIKSSDIVTFPSNAAKKIFFKEIDNSLFANKQIEIVYNGIEISKIKKLDYDHNFKEKNHHKTTFLNIANHIAPKNIKVLVEVFNVLVNKLNRKDFIIYNIGWGSQTEEISKLISKYNLKNNFVLLGKLKNSETLKILKAVDYFITFAERVIFDLVVLEALAAGVTIIASNNGGNKEAIIDNYNGYLIDLTSIKNVAHFLNNIKKINKVKILKSAEKFSVEKMVEEYNKLYNKT